LSWGLRLKRWLVERAVQDARIRRMALNRIFKQYGADGVLCRVPFDDHTVFVDPCDDRIAYSLLSGRSWQRAHLTRAIELAVGRGDFPDDAVFVDVGANIGLMTVYALLSGRFSRAIAIEPDPWNREILKRNLEANDLTNRVVVVGKAVSERAGAMMLHRDAKNLGAHSLEPAFVMSSDAAVEVPVDRLDDILEGLGLAASQAGLIKIDVEGHEFAALAGMARLFEDQRPPLMIEVTFGPEDATGDFERLRTLLPRYEHVADIEHDEMPLLVAFDKFQVKAAQHELLIC